MTRERAARSCRFARAGATGETWMPLRCTHDQNLVARASAIGETWMLLRCTHDRNLVARKRACAWGTPSRVRQIAEGTYSHSHYSLTLSTQSTQLSLLTHNSHNTKWPASTY